MQLVPAVNGVNFLIDREPASAGTSDPNIHFLTMFEPIHGSAPPKREMRSAIKTLKTSRHPERIKEIQYEAA